MILVTGASGALGKLVAGRLAGRDDLVAGTRSPEPSPAGPPVRRVDFDDPASLAGGFAGVRTLLIISAGYAEDDVVIARHGAAIEAAATAGVKHVIYTSLAGSGDHLTIALPHRWTEAALAAAPFDTTVLRNGLYAEVPVGLTMMAGSGAVPGVLAAPWGHGQVSVVAREDLADVAARVVAEVQDDVAAGRRSRHAGRTYELDGVETIGAEDVAAALADVRGVPVSYRPSPLGAVWTALAAKGVPPYQVAHAVSIFSNIGAGLLAGERTDLPGLLGAAPRPVRALVAGAVRAST
ncbi:NAD(P)H-binding protein [Streptosporangium roseum]|uniref:NAD(P)H-binding protein n=1 Tax=Streptosporangium roseum TaxID=2001 RepID=UPI00331C22EE